MKSTYKNYRRLEIGILVAAGVLLIYVAISMVIQTGWNYWFDSNFIGNYGSFLGGVATVFSIYYLYRTLRDQGRQFQIQNFEGRFLELIRFNRNAVSQMSCIDTSKIEEPRFDGKSVFEIFYRQIEEAIKIVTEFVEGKNIKELYSESNERYEADKSVWKEERLLKRNIINVAFLITFFGVKYNGYDLLKTKYLSQYNSCEIEKLLRIFRLKLSIAHATPDDSKKWNPVIESEIINNENKYFEGFQYNLGNYFRTLFQCVKYVNEQSFLSFQEKYEYVKMLRCQMSNAEEMVLFYDTISDLGMAWEYDEKNRDDINKQLITKYNIIKNIPMPSIGDYPTLFYPNVAFENLDNTFSRRKDLEAQYT
ncbi:putative phage abortive infection protein [Porphyromonas gingivalis]|uniref:putative phage abortive infection protein n=1 Tax=Porphyromonas gingivalis TaxID=837 RepID=UPI001F19DEBF|nr:putative phage abortive infection protein [Porphyromonas gingivalis]MCE8170626.1 putative phage abortive infection protein [Porphyromonas gingivalis]